MPQAALKLISSMATRELLTELVSSYQRATGQSVTPQFAGGVDVAARVRSGEVVDIVVLASTAIEGLIADGRLFAGSRVDLVSSGVAVAVRAGAVRPDIGSEESLKRAVLAARTVSYSTGPSGTYLNKLFERWGILGEIGKRIVMPPPGKPVGSLIAEGTAELGFQQASELLNLSGVDVLGPLPPEIQIVTVFSAGISVGSTQREAARAMLNYLASPAVSPVKRRYGMEPASD